MAARKNKVEEKIQGETPGFDYSQPLDLSGYPDSIAAKLAVLPARQARFVLEYCDIASENYHNPTLALEACGVDLQYARGIARGYLQDRQIKDAILAMDEYNLKVFDGDDAKKRLALMLIEDHTLARNSGNLSAAVASTKTLCQLYGQLSDNLNVRVPEAPPVVRVEFVESGIDE